MYIRWMLNMRTNKPKTALFSLALIPILITGYYFFPKGEQIKAEKQALVEDEPQGDTLISLIAVGDMMLGTNFPGPEYLPAGNILEPVSAYLQAADITFGNLEGTVLNSGGEVKKCSDPKTCYAFRQPEYVVDYLKGAGFDLLSVANNHMGDFGQTGRDNTQRVLKEKGIHYAGLETCPKDTFHVKGIVVGMTAVSPNSACLRLNDYEKVAAIVKELNSYCDIVIVSFHGGAEGSSKQHVPKQKEIFLGEDRGNVYEFARVMIDAGADVILGHGPHVTRGIDSYKGKFITYSMGNFATYARFSLSGPNGIAPIYKLYLTRKGDFVRGEIMPIQQLGEGGPTFDPAKRVLQVIKDLSTQDFPETKWQFEPDGKFFLRQ
jgi:poly-gamma-glutamate capsule biosynthesis protein CapA/YwtB (metallophosphatase superfamily)